MKKLVKEEFDISQYITAADVASAIMAGVIAYIKNRPKVDDQQQQPQGGASKEPRATGGKPAAAAPEVDPDSLPSFNSWQNTVDSIKRDDKLFDSVAKAAGCWKGEVDGDAIWDYAAKNKMTVGKVVELIKKISDTSGNGRWHILIDKEPGMMDFIAKARNMQDAIVAYSNAGNTVDWHMMREFGLSDELQNLVKTNTIDAFRKEYTNLPQGLMDKLAEEVGIGYRSVDSLERVANYATQHPELVDGLTAAINQSAIGDATTIVNALKMYSEIGKSALADGQMKRLMKYSTAFCDLLKRIDAGTTDVNDTAWNAVNING